MARRTIASKYAAADRFATRERKLFSFADHREEIYYLHPEKDSIPSDQAPTAEAKTSSNIPLQPVNVPASTPVSSSAMHVPDATVKSEDIIRAIVANKLKKPFENIPLGASIKDLSAGQSLITHAARWYLTIYR